MRVVSFLALLLTLGCPGGFTIDLEDTGVRDAETDAAVPDVPLDTSSSDAGPTRDTATACVPEEPCDDGNACTEGERCTATGCADGAPVRCEGALARCEGDTLIEETFTGACDESTGCAADLVATLCRFSCAAGVCTECRTTEWAQSSLPFEIRDSSAPIARFAIDEVGGQHVLFPTERLHEGFLEVAVDYAYRSEDGEEWEVTPITPPGGFVPHLSLALHHQEAHFLIAIDESTTYWRPAGGSWVDEVVLGRGDDDSVDLVITPDGQPHVFRAGFSLMHSQRSVAGVWTEERVDWASRPGRLSARVLGDAIHVVFRDGDDSLGFARFDGTEWTLRMQTVEPGLSHPSFAIAVDGTIAVIYSIGDRQVGLGTMTPSGEWSELVLTTGVMRATDEHAVVIDRMGGTHVVFQTIDTRVVHYGYRRPGGSVFTFRNVVEGTESAFNLLVDDVGKLRMVSEHVLPVVGSELRFSTRQTCF